MKKLLSKIRETQKKLSEQGGNEEKIDQLETAMDSIMEAQEIVDDVVADTPVEDNYKAYGRYGFDQLLGNGNPYDGSIPKIKEDIKNEYEDYV